jgi:hypothetical protein
MPPDRQIFIPLVLAAGIPVVYSYLLYKRVQA